MDLEAVDWPGARRHWLDRGDTVGVRRTPRGVRRHSSTHRSASPDLLARGHGSSLAFARLPTSRWKAAVLVQPTAV